MTCVEDREILLLLIHVRHAEVPTHRVWKQLRIVWLLGALDIQHMRVDLRPRRVFDRLVPGVLGSKDLWPVYCLQIAIKCRGGKPLVCRASADQCFDCKNMREQKLFRRLSMLKDQRGVGEVLARGKLPLVKKLADLRTARIPMPVIFRRRNIPWIFRLIFNLELMDSRNRSRGRSGVLREQSDRSQIQHGNGQGEHQYFHTQELTSAAPLSL